MLFFALYDYKLEWEKAFFLLIGRYIWEHLCKMILRLYKVDPYDTVNNGFKVIIKNKYFAKN